MQRSPATYWKLNLAVHTKDNISTSWPNWVQSLVYKGGWPLENVVIDQTVRLKEENNLIISMNAGKKALIKSPLIYNKNLKRKPLRKPGIEGHFLSSKWACGREGPTLPSLCPLPATLVEHVVNSAQFPLRFPASYPVWSDHMTTFWPKGYECKWLWQFLVTPWKVRSVPSPSSSSSPVGGMQTWGWQLGQPS